MYIEQIYTECLAEAAYYVESENEAIIIDPMRDIDKYLELAKRRKSKIKYIMETHFHADFVSGHIDLANKTGAEIVFGPNADPKYKVRIAKDEELFRIGNVKIKVLHTPGHTLESSSYLLYDEQGKEHALFSGDTLFVGDVGRPDLAVKSNLSQADLASLLYKSLKTKIMPLEDSVILYPGHGAGSACGKNIGTELSCTIGKQKKSNYALAIEDEKEFIKAVTDGLSAPPNYFFHDATVNKSGYRNLDEVLKSNSNALTWPEIKSKSSKALILLDTRDADNFEKAYIQNSINIGLNGQFASWVGTLIDYKKSIIIVAENDEKAHESILRLARIGFENVLGFLSGGFNQWKDQIDNLQTVQSIHPNEIESKLFEGIQILDVRRESEFEQNHLKSAINIPLSDLNKRYEELNVNETYMIYCLGGYRSMIASSILKTHNRSKIINVYGGFREIEKEKLEFSN